MREKVKMFLLTIFHRCNFSFNSINVAWDMFFCLFAKKHAREMSRDLSVCWTYLNSLFINQQKSDAEGKRINSYVMEKFDERFKNISLKVKSWKISDFNFNLIGFVLQGWKHRERCLWWSFVISNWFFLKQMSE